MTTNCATLNNFAQESSFDQMMQRTYSQVLRLAFRLSKNMADAEDLTQQAFLRAFRSFDQFDRSRKFENWVFTIVTRCYLDLQRSRSRRIRSISYDAGVRSGLSGELRSIDFPDPNPDPEEYLLRGSMNVELHIAVDELPENYRSVVNLLYIEGLSTKQIATHLSIAEGTVRSRLHRAIKLLRKNHRRPN